MLRVHFRKENVTVHVPEGTNLRRACLDHDIDPYPVLKGMLSCRGKGFCGTCVVQTTSPEALSPPTSREQRWLRKNSGSIENLRLSCQAKVTGETTITTDPDLKDAWRSHAFYSGRPVRSWKVDD